MERPVIMVDTDEMPVFCCNQGANVKCIFQRLMSAAGRVLCSY